jgi:small subunit ribosomal protein S2
MSIRSLIALVPVCALAVACGGEATPEPATPDAAAAGEEKPADAAAPAADAEAAPAGDAAAAPAGDAAAAPAPEAK